MNIYKITLHSGEQVFAEGTSTSSAMYRKNLSHSQVKTIKKLDGEEFEEARIILEQQNEKQL